VLFPVFLSIGIGFWYGKKDPKFDTKFITTFSGTIGLPCIIFYSLTASNIEFNTFIKFAFYILVYVVIFSIIGITVLKILKKDIFRLLPPFILPNTGNMGIPICLFAYGNQGLAIATAITSIILILHFTLNILLSSKKFSFKPLIECIPVYVLLFSLFFVYFKLPVPVFLSNATFLIGYSTIFLVLMSLGVALSKLKVFNLKETFIYSFIRVIIGPLVGFIFIKVFNLSGVEAGVMFIQASMPSAILTYLIARMYSPKSIYNTVAGTVALSTFLSFFTLTVVVFLSLKYFN
tara:strand:+ start:943 stop:1815 length:873 start_codon:yes stop_codon:yes gene_type:complete